MKKLFYGGDIITMEQPDDKPEAILIENDLIIYVGKKDTAMKQVDDHTEIIDLEGKTLMPSFIDPHGHITMLAQFSNFCNLIHCTNFQEIKETLLAYKEEQQLGEDDILMGYGYDHNFLTEGIHPDKELLDQVSTTIPICILHTSSHMCAVNSKTLEVVSITKDTPDPEGGKFARDKEGNPTGYVEEVPALTPVLTYLFAHMKIDFVGGLLKAQEIYLKHGITTVQDGATGYESLKGLTALAKQNLFQIDVVSYVMADEFKKSREEFHEFYQTYQHHFQIGGAKIVLDGSPQGKSAWLTKPYEGEKDYLGYPACKDEVVNQWVSDAVDGKYQILAHCNGDAASDQFIRAYKLALENKEENDLRPVMIHCQTVREDQLDEMAKIHMIPSIFVAHTYYWGDVHLKNLGPIRGANISPAKSALNRGLMYNFHQDPPVIEPDMLHTIWCAVNRKTLSGKTIGENQQIPVYDALKGVTIHAAYAYHEEDKKGSIKVGKLADLVILDQNPMEVDSMDIKKIQVLETIKEGKTLYSI